MAKRKKSGNKYELVSTRPLVTVTDFEKRRQQEKREEETRRKNATKALDTFFEQKKRENSLAKTKAWQEAYNDAKNAGGEDKSWQVYAAKMISDTPGALEKEQERERKRKEEIARQNRLLIQSGFGTPTKGPTLKNELTEKTGPYRTQQKAMNNYIEALKQNKANKERSNPTMTGLQQHGPVVTQEEAISNYNKRLQQKIKELQEEQKKVIGPGHESWEANKEEIGEISPTSYNNMNANRMAKRDKGTYNIGSNLMYMNDAGLDQYANSHNEQAAKLRQDAEDYKKGAYAGVYEYVEGLKRHNEETILHGRYTPEQQATAGRTLKGMEDTYGERLETAIRNAQQTINGYAQHGPEMFAKTMQNQTKDWLYYLLTGEDYAQRVAKMTPEQQAELDEQIEKARQGILNYSEDQYKSMLKEADAHEHLANQVLEEKATRNKIGEFVDWSRHYDSPEYDPSLVELEDVMLNGVTEVLTVKGPKGSREDKAYYYMNNKPGLNEFGSTFGLDQKEYFALPEWVDAYNRLYKADKANGTNQAGAFLDALDPYLTSWKTEYDDYSVRKMAENPWIGIPMRIASYPVNAINAIPNLINTGMALFGNEYASDPNNPVNQTNKWITTGREEQNKDLANGNEGIEFLLGIADSIGDNVVAMGTGSLVTGNVSSKAGMRIVQLIMSGEATGHTFLEQLEENRDPTEAAIYAIGDGIIEAITEKYSLEALLKPDVKSMLGNTRQLMKYFGKASLAEGSEEIASDLMNWGLDYILSSAFNHETELKERYYELIESGMSDQEASRQALLEKFEQVGMSGLAGAISGGAMGMGRAGINYIGNLQAGSQINDAKNIDKMVDIGLRADEGSISRANAEAVQKRITEGKKVRDAEAGKLAQSIMLETNESFGEKSKEARITEIARMLRAKGMSASDAQSMSETLDKAIEAGGIENLSKADQRKINKNKAASSVYNKLAYNAKTQTKVNTKIDAATEAEQRVHNAVSSMFTRTQAMGAKYVGRNRATEDDLRKATGTEVKGPMSVIVLNADRFDNAKLTGVRKVNGQIKYTVEIDGKEQTVDASQIRARNIGTAAIIEKSTNDPHLYNMGYTNKLLQVMNTLAQQEQPDALMIDAYRMRMAAFKGQAMPKALINEKAAKELYDYSRIEYQAIRQEETKEANRNALKPGQGTATFAGYQFGTKEFDDALDSSNMSESEKEKIRVYAALSKAAGTQVAFRSIEEIQQMALTDEDMSIFKGEENKLYGAESKSGILINLGGENITTDPVTGEKQYSKHDIGVTYGHEFLHFLQRNSLKGYNDIVKYVFDTQAKNKGEAWVNQQLENYMRNQDIDLNEAIFEFVADSCDSIFSSKEVIDHIANTNKTLYGEIKSFVKDLFTRVRAALANMRGSMSEAGAQMINTNYRALGKLVNVAWDEAASGQIITPEEYQQMVAEETGAAEDRTKFSRAEELGNKIRIGLNDQERYDLLKGTIISLADSTNKIKPQTIKYYDSIKVEEAKDKIPELARRHKVIQNNKPQTYTNKYMNGKTFEFSNRSLKTSIQHQGDQYGTFAALMPVFRETLENAVPLLIQNDRYLYTINDKTNIDTYAILIGGFKYNNHIIPVEFEIKKYNNAKTNNPDSLYIVATMKKGTVLKPGTPTGVAPGSRAPSIISIDNLIKEVNNTQQNLLTAIPSGFLNNQQKTQKINELEYQGKYINTKATKSEIKNTETVKVTADRINNIISEAENSDKNTYMTVVDPNDFVELVDDNWLQTAAEGRVMIASEIREEQTTPYIEINSKTGEIINSDGVRRLLAMAQAGIKNVPVVIKDSNKNASPNLRNITVNGVNGSNVTLSGITPVNENNRSKLLKRFDAGDNWYRFSRAQLDNEYMAAVESGDEATQRAILDAAAKKNGYTMKVYHGTPTGGFTTFRDWSYFTESKAYADRYNHPSQSSTRGYAVNASRPMTYELYFNPGRVFDTRDPETAKIFNQIRMEYGLSELQEDGLPDWTDGRDLIEYIEENDLPYDTIVLNEGADGGYGAPVVSRGESYVTRSNMIKSTDLVTYDDDGQVIPPSERFDKNKNDIRYSRAVEETKDLIAYHNLGPEQLMAVLHLGGFAMPSIAITRDNYVNDRYGDITVLFRKDTIDPKKSSANKVYGGDAWTPVYPTIEYKVSKKRMDAVKTKISKLVPSKYQIRLYELDAEDVEKKVNSYRGDIVKAVKDNTNLMAAYLADKGQEVNYPMREKRLDGFNKFDNQQVIRAYNLLGDEAIINAYEMGNTYQYLKEHQEIVNKLRDEMNEYWKEQLAGKVSKETKMKLLDKALYDENNFGTNQAEHLIEAAYKYMKQGIQSELDTYALQDTLRKQVEADEEGYENWLKEQLNGAIEKSGIRNNKDFFDRMGNRRSWETLHDPETLENVVRVMKAQLDKGATGFFSQSELLALGTKDFKSLDDIRKDKARLQHISDEEMSAAKTDIINRFDKLVTALADPRESNQFIERDRVFSAIADTVRSARTAEGIQRIMNEWRYKVTSEQAQEIADLMVEISNLPTEYFEAKPKRAVMLDEIAKVILPENTDQALLDALTDANIAWEFYDGTSEDRLAKMNANEDVKFSRWTESGMDVNYWMEHVTPSALQTEDEWKMVQAYRGKRTSMALSLKKQLDMKAQIRQLEGKADLTTEDRNALIKLRNNLKTEQDKYARLEDEIAEITSDSGWAGIMRQHNVVFRDYMEGKTQEQVQAAIDSLTEEVKRSEKNIARQEKELAKMEEESAVQTVKKLLARKGLARTATALRSEYSTAMSDEELKNRLAEIVIRNANGEDITADVEALATDVITNQTGMANEVADEQLYPLRGMTIELSPAQMKELKAQGSSLAEIRRRTKGSGIRFVEGDKFTLESNIGDIIDQNSSLRDKLENAGNSLDNFVKYVEKLLELKQQSAAENIDRTELEAFITASANIMLNENAGGMNKTELTDAIRQEAGKIGRALAAVRKVKGSMEGLKAAGQKAQTWAGVLNEDTQQALKYYNKMARLAAETERKRVKQNVIESLKSEHAKAMLQQAEKFREQMANDKKARELAEDNAALRNKISTVATRMANRIFAETDRENVPEEAKALVRQVLDMVSAHDNFFRKVTYWDKQKVENVRGRLQRMIAHYGKFDADNDLDWLVVKAPNPADNDYTAQDKVMQDLVDIETGLLEYRNAEGQGRISLADRKAALTKVQEALSEIWDVIKARSEMEINGRKWQVIELAEWMRGEMANSRFKGERKGVGSRTRDTLTGAVTWGNLTPEYFFKNLKNRAMDQLHIGLKNAEDRSGLEAAKAKVRLAEIAEKDHFASWDGQEKHTVRTRSGDITMTTEQVMALYATWLREGNQMRPADTSHLLNGGFVLADKDENKGKPGREKKQTRPIRMNKEQLAALGGLLTDEQKQYVEDMVAYMSGELAELGNEASMKMYGIKKFTEEYYFPIKSWGGVLNRRSDAGISASNENRAAQQGFSKRVKNNASNAIEIGDFTPTAIKHVAGMITYNTVGPAIENMNKVLNQQLKYGEVQYTESGEEEDNTYKLNMRAAFQNAYGKQAADYLAKFMLDMNGGVTQERTPFDKLLSLFKKNAVAGSLSVAAQQPLSYIRAAMMINPKYLAQAILPQYWKGSFAEMMKHSGVAVIKQMGKFDMNFGQTMQEWIAPEGMESKARKAWNKTSDIITGLPGAMDAMTWTRMWTAVKLEQMAENKGMDYSSDEFMKKVAERFNELMRRTQVYDSVMTKSQNMRSNHFYAKTLTSFMAEPTLSLNVLADAFQNLKEKGGKATAVKAIATFLLSAAAQAGAKAFFGAGRSPDKKKNREENFLNKFWYNLLSEANPLGLIPGYRQIIETLNEGELKDDTMSMVAKGLEVVENIWKLATEWDFSYRNFEDSIGQFMQLTTDIPAKNLMRDFRAMVNWFSNGTAEGFTGNSYAQRGTSKAMLKNQFIETLISNDLGKLINDKLGDAGYKITNDAYYQRIVDAEKAGNQEAADQLKEFIILKGKAKDPEGEMNEKIRGLYKVDEDLSAEERLAKQKEYGMKAGGSFVKEEYKKGNLTRKEAEKLYRQENPKASNKDVLEAFDKIDWEKSGKNGEGYSNYTPLMEAISNNKTEEIRKAADHMLKNGYKASDIKSEITSRIKKEYLAAKTEKEKLRLRDALTKTYKALGYTADDADKTVKKWIKEKK